MGDFGQHVVHRTANFFTASIGYNTESAVFGAAFHDRNKRRHAVSVRLGQAVKLLNLGEADIYHYRAIVAGGLHHLGQAVQGLWHENQVYDRHSFGNVSVLLAVYTDVHPKNQIW